MAGQVFAVASGKGGVGKTTTAVNLGVVLRRADHSVALVDADLGMANLGTVVGIEGESSVHDVLAGEATVEEALVEEAPGFAVLPGSGDLATYPGADPRGLAGVLETLADAYEYVIVDTGAGMSHEDVLPLGIADRTILVTTPDPAAIGDTTKTAELAELAGGTVAGLVVTMAASDTDTTHVALQVGVDLLGVIPFDPTVRESTASGQPLEAVDPDSAAAVAYRELAARLDDGAVAVDSDDTDTATDAAGPDSDARTADDDPAEPTAATASEAGDGGAATAGPAVRDDDAESDETDSSPTNGDTDGTDRPTAADEAAEPAETGSQPTPDDEATPETEAEAPTEDAAGGEPDIDDETGTAETVDPDEEEDYLAEFEDEPEPSGGFFSKLGRIFR